MTKLEIIRGCTFFNVQTCHVVYHHHEITYSNLKAYLLNYHFWINSNFTTMQNCWLNVHT